MNDMDEIEQRVDKWIKATWQHLFLPLFRCHCFLHLFILLVFCFFLWPLVYIVQLFWFFLAPN